MRQVTDAEIHAINRWLSRPGAGDWRTVVSVIERLEWSRRPVPIVIRALAVMANCRRWTLERREGLAA